MCGISGYYVKNPSLIRHGSLEKLTDGLLYGIASRGWDAAGFAAFTREDWSNPVIEKEQGTAAEFVHYRSGLPLDPRAVLLHTRFATQGSEYFDRNNHPVRYGDVVTVHNGIIWNDEEVFRKLGLKRKAEVDTEAISAAIYHHGFERFTKALSELTGSYAIATASTKHPDTVVLARGNDSPLAVHESENLIVWASTSEAILQGWGYGIGTPPDRSKIRIIPPGTLITINQDGVQRSNFTPKRGYTYHDFDICNYTPARKTEPLALPSGSYKHRPSDYSEGSKTLLRCASCFEFVPWDEMVESPRNEMICKECDLYGESYQPGKHQCEFCGTSKGLIKDEFGMHICESCLDMLLRD